MSVELLGLPASGKSTLSRRAAEVLSSRGVVVAQRSWDLAHGIPRWERRTRKAARVAAEAALHPLHAAWSAAAIARSGQPGAADVGRMTFNWLLVAGLERRRGEAGGIELHDQGIFQALWSIGFGAGRGAATAVAAALGPRMPLPSVLAVVRAGPQTVERRLSARPDADSRLDRMDPAEGLSR
ncbi:MAG TPA: hypothetical protein VJV23_00865, partial [Candidatus Polarisedimenticolia bacterium]|nr:hypothetical protein [Candidatus Polarisedimenticolia bacterium]